MTLASHWVILPIRVSTRTAKSTRSTTSAVSTYQSYPHVTNQSFVDTDNLEGMVTDQLAKMASNADNDYLLLSWTLTQSESDAIACSPPVLSLADSAYPDLYTKLLPACNENSSPNILFVDGFQDTNVVALAMAINTLFLRCRHYGLSYYPTSTLTFFISSFAAA